MGIMLGIMFFMTSLIVAVVCAPIIKDLITDARGPDIVDPATGEVTTAGMDCGSADLTTGQAATCVVIDLTLVLFVGVVIFAGLGLITDQFTGG